MNLIKLKQWQEAVCHANQKHPCPLYTNALKGITDELAAEIEVVAGLRPPSLKNRNDPETMLTWRLYNVANRVHQHDHDVTLLVEHALRAVDLLVSQRDRIKELENARKT